jgi:hypothetical protein
MNHVGFHCGPDAEAVILVLIITLAVLLTVIVAAIKALIFCKIFSKAGYCWGLGLLMLVPIANIIMPFVLAFGDWPVCRELRRLKEQAEAPPAPVESGE